MHAVRLAIAGRALVLLGYIDQARSRMGEALSLARRIRNAPALVLALISANMLDLVTGSPLIHAEELLAVTTEQKLVQFLGWGMAFRGLALAADGVVFERAYSHAPQTLPAHASLLSGQLPFETGVRDNVGFTVTNGVRLMPQMLRDRGFATGGVVSAFVLRKET
ncbi:hypothetical protein B4Q13_24010, partial [Lacticaseibacillus rhamnosus]